MEIRKIQIKDAENIQQFFNQLDVETEFMLFEKEERKANIQQQISMVEHFNQSSDEQMFIATKQDKILGFIVVTRKPFLKVRHCFQLVIGVLQQAQGLGLASKMYQFTEDWAIEHGAKRIELTVISQNIRAIYFYEKIGFKSEGIRKNSIYMNDCFYDELYMAKVFD